MDCGCGLRVLAAVLDVMTSVGLDRSRLPLKASPPLRCPVFHHFTTYGVFWRCRVLFLSARCGRVERVFEIGPG